jgi:DNA-directed RNA polymerase subunit RPC12/RpoP
MIRLAEAAGEGGGMTMIEYDCADCGQHVAFTVVAGFFDVAEEGKRCNSCQWIRDNVAPEHHGDARERLGVPLARR